MISPRVVLLAGHGVGARRRGGLLAKPRDVPVAVGIFVGVPLSLQIFLLTVGLDALHARDTALAWTSPALSVVLAAGSAAFYRYLR